MTGSAVYNDSDETTYIMAVNILVRYHSRVSYRGGGGAGISPP